jgi:catechol 2,3-dioxygenase-like lactoylglutathione lyase family enzyme
MEWRNEEFDLGGVNHLALVCSDMKRTVEFYTQVLGMRLIKTIELPAGAGQHFFFDMGGGNALAFFWFPDAPEAVPGVSAPVTVPGLGEWTSAVGSMNHVAFNVPEERFVEYRAKLKAKGLRVSPVLDHDDSEFGVAREPHPGVFVRSF